jgi:programmed cell death protein 5
VVFPSFFFFLLPRTHSIIMDEDAELEMLRQQRLAELQGGKGRGAQEEQRRREMEERRSGILGQLLTAEARERLARISLVKPDKARRVEDMILSAAQSGQLSGKIDEPNLISLLGQISNERKQTKITYQRRKWDEDD